MKKNRANTILLLLPWCIIFIIFWLYPLLYTGFLSLNSYDSITNENNFIGLANYEKMFIDPLFWKALANTSIFTLGTVPFTVAIALGLATLLNSKAVKFKEFFRASFFAPAITSVVVISLIFTNLYAKNGYINKILETLGLPASNLGWLSDPSTALPAIMLMDIWSACGYYMIIFLAAMQTIPQSLYDSAVLMGAKPFLVLRKITIPMIKSSLVFVLVINVIKSFQIFMEIYVMTKGGPLYSTTTLVYMVFTNAFEKSDSMGYAAAIAYFLFFLLLILSFIQLKLIKNK